MNSNVNPAGYKTFNGGKEDKSLVPDAFKQYDKHVVKAHMNYIFCENLETQKETKGGIVIPDTVKQSRKWCRVISVGPKCSEGYLDKNGEKKQLKAGDFIIYHQGVDVPVGGGTFVATPEHNVLVVLPLEDQ